MPTFVSSRVARPWVDNASRLKIPVSVMGGNDSEIVLGSLSAMRSRYLKILVIILGLLCKKSDSYS
jgi:hypothetical protein